jgi:hypothetical protein
MEIAAVVLALMVLTLVAGCLLWTLLCHFEEFYPVAKDRVAHGRRAGFLFRALTGLTTVGILVVLLLEFQQLLTSPV